MKLKDLKTEKGRQQYYEYDVKRPDTLVPHEPPVLDPVFNELLLDVWGTCPNGDPRLRIVWGGSEPATRYKDVGDRTIAYEGRKYQVIRIKKTTGWVYRDDKGRTVVAAKPNMVPKDKVAVEQFDYFDLGRMRWILEMKYTAEECVASGWYPEPDSEREASWGMKDGKRYADPPDPKGMYVMAKVFETPDGKYRDVQMSDIEAVVETIRTAENETEYERFVRKREQYLAMKRAKAIAKEEWKNAQIQDAIVRAEKKLARGKIIYG